MTSVENDVATIGPNHSPYSIVQRLNKDLPKIREIYVVYADQKGDWFELFRGDNAGASFASLVLQRAVLKNIGDKL